MSSHALWLEEVSVVRGKTTVVKKVSLEIPRGKITGLLGPSGSGKTTLLRAIVGVQQKVTGTTLVLGQPAGSLPLRSSVAYATQDSSVFSDLSVRENVSYAAQILGAPQANIDAVIDRVGLTAQRKQIVRSLSGGQRSRASLAIALVGNPQVLLLDEPTVGLDPLLRVELWELFRSIADEGRTLLVSSHVMDEAERCDMLVLMRHGHVLDCDTLPNILARTHSTTAEEAFIHIVEGNRA